MRPREADRRLDLHPHGGSERYDRNAERETAVEDREPPAAVLDIAPTPESPDGEQRGRHAEHRRQKAAINEAPLKHVGGGEHGREIMHADRGEVDGLHRVVRKVEHVSLNDVRKHRRNYGDQHGEPEPEYSAVGARGGRTSAYRMQREEEHDRETEVVEVRDAREELQEQRRSEEKTRSPARGAERAMEEEQRERHPVGGERLDVPELRLPQRVEREQCSARQCCDEGPAELVHEQRDTGRPQREGDEHEHVVLENGTVMDEIDRKKKERSGEHVLREG